MVDNDSFFQAYILESPSPDDLFRGKTEGRHLQVMLDLIGTPSTVRLVVNRAKFIAALTEGLLDLIQHTVYVPILHLMGLVRKEGIELTDGYVFAWQELRDALELVNHRLGVKWIVCISCRNGCKSGLYAAARKPTPYAVLVGNAECPTRNETVIGFGVFYHLLNEGKTIKEAVDGMKAAAGKSKFKRLDAADVKTFSDPLTQFHRHRFREAMGRIRDLDE